MKQIRHLHVGGVVAMGFACDGEYLLVIGHNGRGVYSTRTWDRVARDHAAAYPENGYGIGIGPIANVRVPVAEMNFSTETVLAKSPGGDIVVEYESGSITIFEDAAEC
jgi:hypothetical protein